MKYNLHFIEETYHILPLLLWMNWFQLTDIFTRNFIEIIFLEFMLFGNLELIVFFKADYSKQASRKDGNSRIVEKK